ncbi:unannotated protein [freshwater metagenome]|uniref:Unannotated protein n=1 Tax=freshwater metagenome TaxID=449393 RepID=A0A6J7IFC1_9ZZZZ
MTARTDSVSGYSRTRVQPSSTLRSQRSLKARSIGSKGSTGAASRPILMISPHASGTRSPSITCTAPSVLIDRTVMLFIVRVPVLSTQTTVADPRVSMTGGRLVRTFLRDMRQAPRARNTVRTTGNSSGSIAIAVAMPASAPSSQLPRVRP